MNIRKKTKNKFRIKNNKWKQKRNYEQTKKYNTHGKRQYKEETTRRK